MFVGRTGGTALPGIGTLNIVGAGSTLTRHRRRRARGDRHGCRQRRHRHRRRGRGDVGDLLIGVAHDGSGSTGGVGTLVVNGNASAGPVTSAAAAC